MSNVSVKYGNLFASGRQTLVNTVNCVGVMGAGIALEFKRRYPAMFRRYEQLCRQGHMKVGRLWLYRPDEKNGEPWVLNFPTKKHWRLPSREEYLVSGLTKFRDTYRQCGIASIAFPVLGSQNGGLCEAKVIDLMREALQECEIPVDIYRYDPRAKDDLIDPLKSVFLEREVRKVAELTGIDVKRVDVIRRALQRTDVRSVSRLAATRGIGEKTLAKALAWVRRPGPAPSTRQDQQTGIRMSEPVASSDPQRPTQTEMEL